MQLWLLKTRKQPFYGRQCRRSKVRMSFLWKSKWSVPVHSWFVGRWDEPSRFHMCRLVVWMKPPANPHLFSTWWMKAAVRQQGMNTSNANQQAFGSGREKGKKRLCYPRRPPPHPSMHTAISRTLTPPPDDIRELVVFVGPQWSSETLASAVLGAAAVTLIAGSQTIQRRNVNPEHGCSWTCRIEEFSF